MGSLSAALFQTGIGDGLWPFHAAAFGGRWGGYFCRFCQSGSISMPSAPVFRVLRTNLAVTVVLWTAVFLWFCRYEGRKSDD